MDLISIAQTVWRHKLVVIPVVLLTLAAGLYILKFKPPVYESTGSFLLDPPVGPTTAQIAKNPKLAKISPSNPYLSLGGQVDADVVISLVSSSAVQQVVVKEGGDPQYQIAPSPLYGSPPIIDVTGIGPTPQQAILTAKLVEAQAMSQLYQVQKRAGASDWWLIKPYVLTSPVAATATVSGKLRTLVTVLALGTIMVFVAISLAEAIARRRTSGPNDGRAAARAELRQKPRREYSQEADFPASAARPAAFRVPRWSGSGRR